MADDIVSRLLAIDKRAEELYAAARREVESIHRETVKLTEAAKSELHERIARGVAEAEAGEKEARKATLAQIEKETAAGVARAKGTAAAALARAVETVVARARGASQ